MTSTDNIARTTTAPEHQEHQQAISSDAVAKKRDSCPECDGNLLEDESTGETHCADCGIVIEESKIDRGPEWRNFEGEDNQSRIGAPITNTMHDRGLSTVIGSRNKDGYGKRLSQKRRRTMDRLRKWDSRSKTENSKDRNLRKGLTEILRMASALGLPDNVRETASIIFRQASKKDLLKGRSIEEVASSAIYISARQSQIPRTFEDIATVSRVDKLTIERSQRRIRRELNIEVSPANPTEYIPQFASKLDIDNKIEAKATKLTKHFSETHKITGRQPTAVAATAIYASGLYFSERIRQRAISEECPVSTTTIQNTYKHLIAADPENEFTYGDISELTYAEIRDKLMEK